MGEDTLGRAERKGSGIQEMQCEKLGNIEQKPVKVIGGGKKSFMFPLHGTPKRLFWIWIATDAHGFGFCQS